MSFDGRAIANHILDQCDAHDRAVTNLALQKIVYFCHVWSLIKLGKPLVKHKFEAWQHGPVLQYLYQEFKDYDRNPITTRATALDFISGNRVVAKCNFDEATASFLDTVIEFYSQLTAGYLVELSHARGGPWDRVWNHGEKTNPGMKIDDEEIVAFYSKAISQLGIQ